MTTYDAIVVGARCAGSPTAMLLARKGYRVLLLDRASFPSDTLSCHFIHQPGVASLKRWGLLPAVERTDCPPVREQSLDVGPLVLRGAAPPAGDVAEAYCLRRTLLDKLLVDAAVDAGVELRERFSVDEIVRDDERVTGIRGRAAGGGAAVTETARIVIGADGMGSLVARTVGAPAYDEHPTLTCAYYSYWEGAPIDEAYLYPRPGRMIIAGPTNGGQTMVIIYWPVAEFLAVRSDIERHFDESLDLVPGLAERIRAGTRSERFRGTGRLPNFLRRPYGDGWALVGDAGFHKDPILAQGITDAFRDAELVAGAVDAGLSGRQPMEAALADYERRRNEAVADIYGSTIQFAQLQPPPPEVQQIMAALVGNQKQTDRFFGTVAGTFPASRFFAPENVAEILGEEAPAMA